MILERNMSRLQTAVLLLALLASCVIPTIRSNENVATSLNKFTIDLYNEIRKSVDGNIIFSPFSMYIAFAMVGVGAKGKTLDEMSKVFHWGSFKPLLSDMKPMFDYLTEHKENDSYLAIANNVWVADDMNLLQGYQEEILKTFSAVPQKEAFAKDAESVRQKINKWVEQKTNEKIKDLFPANSITPLTKMALANAIFFKGIWSEPFDVKVTSPGNFFLNDEGSKIQVDFMSKMGSYALYKDQLRGVDVLSLPYSGDKFAVLFVKPDKIANANSNINSVNLSSIEDAVNHNVITDWMNNLNKSRSSRKMRILIPKFEFEQSLEGLIDILNNLGMKDLFTPGQSDLSGMNGNRDLYCSAAVHKAFVKFDEEGTTAAAATGIGIVRTSMPKLFILNQPFLFYIVDTRYNVVIFAGKLMNPSISESSVKSESVRAATNPSTNFNHNNSSNFTRNNSSNFTGNNSALSMRVSALLIIIYPILAIFMSP